MNTEFSFKDITLEQFFAGIFLIGIPVVYLLLPFIGYCIGYIISLGSEETGAFLAVMAIPIFYLYTRLTNNEDKNNVLQRLGIVGYNFLAQAILTGFVGGMLMSFDWSFGYSTTTFMNMVGLEMPFWLLATLFSGLTALLSKNFTAN